MSNSFGENIKTYRLENRLSQQDFADILSKGQKFNVSFKSVSKWEKGDHMPMIDIILAVSQLLCVSIDKLMNTEIEKFRANNPALLSINQFERYHSEEIDFMVSSLRNLRLDDPMPVNGSQPSPFKGMYFLKTQIDEDAKKIIVKGFFEEKTFLLSKEVCKEIEIWLKSCLMDSNIENHIYFPFFVGITEDNTYFAEIYFSFSEEEIIELFGEQAKRIAKKLICKVKAEYEIAQTQSNELCFGVRSND